MLPNTPAMFEAHFGVPMAGGVLNAQHRLDAEALAFMLEHGEARVLLVDPEFSAVVARALQAVEPRRRPLVIDVLDSAAPERRAWAR
jgi:fatty-acyl-CoA synthase